MKTKEKQQQTTQCHSCEKINTVTRIAQVPHVFNRVQRSHMFIVFVSKAACIVS